MFSKSLICFGSQTGGVSCKNKWVARIQITLYFRVERSRLTQEFWKLLHCESLSWVNKYIIKMNYLTRQNIRFGKVAKFFKKIIAFAHQSFPWWNILFNLIGEFSLFYHSRCFTETFKLVTSFDYKY